MNIYEVNERVKNETISSCFETKAERLKEYRCSCGRLLGRFNGQAEVKCPKCGKMNVIGVESHADSGSTR